MQKRVGKRNMARAERHSLPDRVSQVIALSSALAAAEAIHSTATPIDLDPSLIGILKSAL